MRSSSIPGPTASLRETTVDRVFETVAAATDTPATELPRLAATLDAEALDRLFASADDSVTLSFHYHDCEVTVTGDGSVEVQRLAD